MSNLEDLDCSRLLGAKVWRNEKQKFLSVLVQVVSQTLVILSDTDSLVVMGCGHIVGKQTQGSAGWKLSLYGVSGRHVVVIYISV